MPDAQKRAKLDTLTTDVQTQVDEWVATSIPALTTDIADCTAELAAIQVEIDALVAVVSRTAQQNIDLRALRRDKTITQRQKNQLQEARKSARFAVKLARLTLLLDGSRARTSDVTGSDG